MSAERIDVGSVDELKKARKLVVDGPDGPIAVFWHDERPWAMANLCVHADRELVKGSIFQGRVICPGHQWAFNLETGVCAERERVQPVYATEISESRVSILISGS